MTATTTPTITDAAEAPKPLGYISAYAHATLVNGGGGSFLLRGAKQSRRLDVPVYSGPPAVLEALRTLPKGTVRAKTDAETAVLHFLVREIGGHSIQSVNRETRTKRLGYSTADGYTFVIADLLAAAIEPAPHGVVPVGDVAFLLDRLDSFSDGLSDASDVIEYQGHVAPAAARLRAALTSPSTNDCPAVEGEVVDVLKLVLFLHDLRDGDFGLSRDGKDAINAYLDAAPKDSPAVEGEAVAWLTEWQFKADRPGLVYPGGGSSVTTDAHDAALKLSEVEALNRLGWVRQTPLYAHPNAQSLDRVTRERDEAVSALEDSEILRKAAVTACERLRMAASPEGSMWGRWFPHDEAPSGSYACLYKTGTQPVAIAWMPAQGRPSMADTVIMPFDVPDALARAALSSSTVEGR